MDSLLFERTAISKKPDDLIQNELALLQTNHAHILKGKKTYINNLLVYFFKNLNLNPFITGAAQPKLNKANLLNIPVLLPIYEREQNASVLSSLDDKIG